LQQLKENLGEKRYLERGVLEDGGVIDEGQPDAEVQSSSNSRCCR